MTVETRLRDAMADAVAPATPDTDHLVTVARRRGLGIRRRRQALGSVGIATALALAVLAPNVVGGDHGVRDPRPLATASAAPATLDPSRTSPLTGRSTAAALLYTTLQAVPEGLTSKFAWQGSAGPTPETYARFRLVPPDGTDRPGEVGINVQPNFTGKAALDVSSCAEWMRTCVRDRRPDGSILVTYEDVSGYGSGGYRRVASLMRADGVRIVASASNGIDVTERDENVTRSSPPLSTDELATIVEQPWWGAELPTYFEESGATLHGEEIGGVTNAGRASKP